MRSPFDQYEQRGAYHWNVLNYPLRCIGGYPSRLAARYKLVLRQIPDSRCEVLDVGCGDGALTHLIAQKKHSVVGLDPEIKGLRLALRMTRSQTYRYVPVFGAGSAYTLPCKDQQVDVVVMADVIEHLEYPQQALTEACRVLKPGGQLIVSTPQRWPGKTSGRYHFQEFTASELAGLLSKAFAKVQVIGSEPLAWYELYRRRVLGRRLLGFAINILSALGLNPFLLQSKQPSLQYGQLTAIAWKELSS